MRVESRLSWLAVAAGSALAASVAVVGADARWLAAIGGLVARAGHVPSSIPYAAAPSHDWVNVPVLGELVFHALWSIGGDRALVVAQAGAVGARAARHAHSGRDGHSVHAGARRHSVRCRVRPLRRAGANVLAAALRV